MPSSNESVIKKDPMPVVVVPHKEVVLVPESHENSAESGESKQQQEMEVDATDGVIAPSNQT